MIVVGLQENIGYGATTLEVPLHSLVPAFESQRDIQHSRPGRSHARSYIGCYYIALELHMHR